MKFSCAAPLLAAGVVLSGCAGIRLPGPSNEQRVLVLGFGLVTVRPAAPGSEVAVVETATAGLQVDTLTGPAMSLGVTLRTSTLVPLDAPDVLVEHASRPARTLRVQSFPLP
jgi:hypothetical protein